MHILSHEYENTQINLHKEEHRQGMIVNLLFSNPYLMLYIASSTQLKDCTNIYRKMFVRFMKESSMFVTTRNALQLLKYFKKIYMFSQIKCKNLKL